MLKEGSESNGSFIRVFFKSTEVGRIVGRNLPKVAGEKAQK